VAESKNFEVKFTIQALDQAAGVIAGVKANLAGLGQAAKQVGADASGMGGQIAAGLQQAQQQATALQNKISDIGQSLAGMGLALAGAGAAMLAPTALAVKSAGDLEHAMNKVKAVAEATPEDFKKMNDFALQMGQSTVFSAQQTAAGMLELGRAGYKTAEVLATVPTVLQLAAVEEQNVGEVSETLVKILSSFGMGANEAARAGDVLARTSNDSTTSMRALGEALKFAAPVARAIGMDIEETSAYLGVLSNNGLDATLAGTGLRRLLERLMDPTAEAKDALFKLGVQIAKNADGNINLSQTLGRLRDSQMSAADAFKIFGVYGATGALILTQNADATAKFTQRNREAAGALKEMTDITTSGLNAALTKLGNSLNVLMTELGTPFLSVIKKVAEGLAWFVNGLASIVSAVPGLSFVLGTVGGVIGVLLVVFGGLALAAGGLLIAISALTKGWAALTSLSWANIKATMQSTAAHTAETAAIVAKTQAITALGAATSKASAGGAATAGKGGGIGRSVAAGAVGIGAGIGAGEVAESRGAGPITKLAVEMGAFAVATALASKAMNLLGPVIAGVAARAIAALGGISLAALAVPAAIGTAIGAVVTAGVVYVGGWRRDAKAIEKDLDESGKRMADNARARGADISQGITSIAKDSLKEKTAEQLKELRDINTENVAAATGEMTRYAPGTDEYNRYKAMVVVGRENAQVLKEQAQATVQLEVAKRGGAKTPAQQLQETQAFYDVEGKLLDASTKRKQANLKTEEEAYKAQVASDISSAWLREQALEAAEITFAARRIQILQVSHDQSLANKEAAYTKTKALLEEEMKDEAKAAEAKKKLTELEKKHTEDKIASEQKLTEAISAEIDKQLQKKAEHEKKIKDLEQQMRDAQIEGTQALVEIGNKSISESGRVNVKFAEMADILQRASDALPNAPEKAIQLATQARSMANGLVQDITALKNSFLSFQQSTSEGLLNIQKKGMSPYAAWAADLRIVEDLQEQASMAAESGDLEQAQKLAAQAGQKAQGLANAPEGVSQAQAIRIASDAFVQAANLERDIRLAIIAREEARQAQAKADAEKATQIQLAAIQKQVDAAKSQIEALDKNTQALMALKDRIERGIPTTQGQPGEVPSAGQGATGTAGVAEGQPAWQQGREEYGTPGQILGATINAPNRIQALEQRITGAAQSRIDDSRQATSEGGAGPETSKLDNFIKGLQEQFGVVKEAATMILEAAKTKESVTLNVATADGTTTYDSPFS
jgi:TP901 family phage tail tape measure protein